MRSLVVGALWMAPLWFLGCAGANSNWTNLINPWAARATPTPEAAPTSQAHAAATPAVSPRRRARASGPSTAATQKTIPTASASNPKPGEPQLEDTESASGAYGIYTIEPGAASSAGVGAPETGAAAASAGAPAAIASETITLGERPESSGTPASPAASTTGNEAALTPRATPTSAAAPANESIQAKAERMIRAVKATAKKIDQASLSASEASRFALASRLIRNAEKTMTEQDFAAAASLAKKAGDLLAPLPRLTESTPAHR
jgi:hypothetical protein